MQLAYIINALYLRHVFWVTQILQVELHHYEKRLLKLRHLQAEAALDSNDIRKMVGEKIENDMNEVIKRQQRKVEKYHLHLESKIAGKQHVEL